MRTEQFYRTTISYDDRNGSNEVIVAGCDNMILIRTECNGKVYEKLTFLKPMKTKTADEQVKREMKKTVDKICGWLPAKVNGQHFYKHSIKTNQTIDGMSLSSYFEYMIEQ